MYYMGTEKQMKAAPTSWSDGVPPAAKALPVVYWEPSTCDFNVISLAEFVDTEEHLLAALILLGSGGKGKSRLLHLISAEWATAYEKPAYCVAKSIDPLGLLSFTGELRKSAVLCLTDFKMQTSKKGALDSEDLKSLLDVPEGGSIPETRYRPAVFPEGLCRIIALNGGAEEYGEWFRRYGHGAVGAIVSTLGKIQDLHTVSGKLRNLRFDDPDVKLYREAKAHMAGMDPSEQAATRRAAVCFCGETALITEETVQNLRAAARAKAAAGRARRAAAAVRQ
jgi:hypothetical protein